MQEVSPIHKATHVPGGSDPFVLADVRALLDLMGTTRGSVIVRGASGWTALVPSATAGQALASNGTGADPSYQTVGSEAAANKALRYLSFG